MHAIRLTSVSYQGLIVLYDKNVTWSTTTVTKHFYAGGVQVAKMVGTAVYYLHQEALGNTRLETTSTVTIKFKSDYVPYGTAYQPTGSEVFRYTGRPPGSCHWPLLHGSEVLRTIQGKDRHPGLVPRVEEPPHDHEPQRLRPR